jgi:hypothetical protein
MKWQPASEEELARRGIKPAEVKLATIEEVVEKPSKKPKRKAKE